MLQIKTFPLDKDYEANKFIKEHHLNENGVQVRDNNIFVLFDDEIYEGASERYALVETLKTAQFKYLEADLAVCQFEYADEGGAALPPDMQEQQKRAKIEKQIYSARVFEIKKRLGMDAGEPVLFGKKQYAAKVHKDKKADK